MIRITERLAEAETPRDSVTLPFELRRRSRLRTRLEGGGEVGLFLPRGTVLRDGDLLRADNGWVVRVCAAPETVSCARSADPVTLARASYHLGNRHVALQVAGDSVRYLHDHVLDDMVRALGLTVTLEHLPFEPEAGAYGGFGHGHGHSHDKDEPHEGHSHDPEEHEEGLPHEHSHEHGPDDMHGRGRPHSHGRPHTHSDGHEH